MSDTTDRLRTRLAGQRAQARRVLWFERIWPALWPAFALFGGWIAAALFDLPSMLPPLWHLAALAAVIVVRRRADLAGAAPHRASERRRS